MNSAKYIDISRAPAGKIEPAAVLNCPFSGTTGVVYGAAVLEKLSREAATTFSEEEGISAQDAFTVFSGQLQPYLGFAVVLDLTESPQDEITVATLKQALFPVISEFQISEDPADLSKRFLLKTKAPTKYLSADALEYFYSLGTLLVGLESPYLHPSDNDIFAKQMAEYGMYWLLNLDLDSAPAPSGGMLFAAPLLCQNEGPSPARALFVAMEF